MHVRCRCKAFADVCRQSLRSPKAGVLFSQSRSYADTTTIKVPQMAESITEGTLKQWSKREQPRHGMACTN